MRPCFLKSTMKKTAYLAICIALLFAGYLQATEVPFLELKGHTNMVNTAVYSPDGKKIVTASEDGTAKIWDAESDSANFGRELQTLEVQAVRVYSAAFAPDGKEVVTSSFMGAGNDNTVQIWDVETGEALRRLEGETAAINSAIFSPDGKRILTGGMRNTARIWDAKTGKELLTLPGHAHWVRSIDYSQDGKRIVTAGNEIKIWDAETGTELRTLEKDAYSVALSPDGKTVASGGRDYCTRIWDVESGKEIKALYIWHPRDAYTPATVQSIAFSPDGTKIVTRLGPGLNNRAFRIWDTESGRELHNTIEENPLRGMSAVFSPDGTKIVTANMDSVARIWDISAVMNQWADADKRHEAQYKEGYLDLNKEQLKYGFLRLNDLNNLDDFVRFGTAELKEIQTNGNETEKAEAAPKIAAVQAEIAQKKFYDEFAFTVASVRTDGDRGSLMLGIQTRITAAKIDEVLFPMTGVTGTRINMHSGMALAVNGSAEGIRELASGDYRVGVWFTNLRGGPLMFGGAADVMKIEVIKVE